MKLQALVVDDSGVMRKMVMKSLAETKLADFEFTEAEDGQVALNKFKEGSFDIAFVDWNMPNMSGIDFVREVREYERSEEFEAVPMVMITSEKTIGKIQEALDEAGADGFVSKPFTVVELQHKLRPHIDKAEALRAMKQEESEPESSGGWLNKMFG